MDAFNELVTMTKDPVDYRTQLGTQSGPDDFEIEIVDNLR
jgi:hypothetical protein